MHINTITTKHEVRYMKTIYSSKQYVNKTKTNDFALCLTTWKANSPTRLVRLVQQHKSCIPLKNYRVHATVQFHVNTKSYYASVDVYKQLWLHAVLTTRECWFLPPVRC